MVSSKTLPRARLQIGNKTTITLPHVLHISRFPTSTTLRDASPKLNGWEGVNIDSKQRPSHVHKFSELLVKGL